MKSNFDYLQKFLVPVFVRILKMGHG